MKQGLHRLLCLGLALSLLCSLAACGQTESGVARAPAESNGAASEAAMQSDAAAAQEPQHGSTDGSDESLYNGLFDTDRIHSIDVTVADEDWLDLCQNPLRKTKYQATVVVDGETLTGVSFATKGNTSLSFVASDPDSDRYSFKLNFGKYEKGQTYHGLNKLSLNNLYADATYLKDYLSYGLFRKLGVDAPLVSFVWLTVNGADHGLYLAIEDVSESWLERTNEGEGVLYKPETEQLNQVGRGGKDGQFPTMPDGNGNNGQFPTPPNGNNGQFPTPPNSNNGQFPTPPDGDGNNGQFPTPPDGNSNNGQSATPSDGAAGGWPQMPQGGTAPGGFPGQDGQQEQFPGGNFGPGNFGSSSTGADLAYNGEDAAQYSDIFDNVETDADEEAEGRVIAALKALSEGRDLEDYLDTEEIIRYFAAHNFVLNYDSYTGNMLHNYYLYEKNGKLAMLPWDYNLAYGGFGGGFGGRGGADTGATTLINTGIDSPLSGAEESARPMWAWIAEDEGYLSRYHAALDELLQAYFESGAFEQELEQLCALIRPYIEKDPTAFYTVEEFDTAVETLKQFCLLRAKSIRAQLSGELATSSAQQDSDARVDASGLKLSAMGTHSGGPEGREGFQTGRNRGQTAPSPEAGGSRPADSGPQPRDSNSQPRDSNSQPRDSNSQPTDGSTHATP